MNDWEVKLLKDLVPSGTLHWFPDEKTCRKIEAIQPNRKRELDEDSEPGPENILH